jgi:hypothetical protein
MPSWQSIIELTAEFFCALFAPAQCPPGRALQNSSELLSSFELTTEFLLCALLALAQCPLGRASQNSSEILSATVFFSTALPPEVFSNLKSLLLS